MHAALASLARLGGTFSQAWRRRRRRRNDQQQPRPEAREVEEERHADLGGK
jgi:hypothetical protein